MLTLLLLRLLLLHMHSACNAQDLRLILQLLAALLRAEPLLAQPLLGVSIVYTSGQTMDWLDVVTASLNVLPALAATTAPAGALAGAGGAASSSGVAGSFGQQLLAALADCVAAASALAACQPGRVLAALGGCALFGGAVLVPEPLPLVPLEGLAGWVAGQQAAGGSAAVEDWCQLDTLQVRVACRPCGRLSCAVPCARSCLHNANNTPVPALGRLLSDM